jgi:hypothetical protein
MREVSEDVILNNFYNYSERENIRTFSTSFASGPLQTRQGMPRNMSVLDLTAKHETALRKKL